jgi:hypothetical protein
MIVIIDGAQNSKVDVEDTYYYCDSGLSSIRFEDMYVQVLYGNRNSLVSKSCYLADHIKHNNEDIVYILGNIRQYDDKYYGAIEYAMIYELNKRLK